MAERPEDKLQRWIFDTYSVTSEGLGLFRIFTALFILFFLIPGNGVDYFTYLLSLPPEFYNPPPGPLSILSSFPPESYFYVVYICAMVSLVGLLAGLFTKTSSIIAGLSILALQGLVYSIGKVNHEIMLPIVPLIMAFSNWGAAYSADSLLRNKKREAESWPLVMLSLFVAFMMLTAGVPKLLGGWLDPTTHAVKGHILNQYVVKGRDALLAEFVLKMDLSLFWEALDYATILFEVGFIFSILRAGWFRFFLIIAVGFHFSTQLLMNIAFLPNFVAYAAFLKWSIIHDGMVRFQKRRTGQSESSAKRSVIRNAVLGTVVIFSIIKWISLENIYFSTSDLTMHEFLLLSIAMLIVLAISIRFLYERFAGVPGYRRKGVIPPD